MKLRQFFSLTVIKVARKFFYNTPVQRWKFTSYVYDTVFHAGYSEKELHATYFGAKLTFPGRDFTITPGLVGGFYEKFELEIFQKLCATSKRVVDVGGNIGLYSVIAGNSGCYVEAFEPVPENFKYLKINSTQNGLEKKITIHHKAVSSKEGKAKIYLAKKNIGTHSLAAAAADSSESINVSVVTLDKFIKPDPQVDILKIDVEGFDGYVLEGAKNLINDSQPTLFIEMVPRHLEAAEYNPADFVNFIFDAYQKVYLIDEIDETVKVVDRGTVFKYVETSKSANLIASSKTDHQQILSEDKG